MPWKGHSTRVGKPGFSSFPVRRRERAAEEKMKMTVSKRPKKAAPEGTSERVHRDKGKEPVEVAESPNYPPTVRELHEVDNWAGKDRLSRRCLNYRDSMLRAR
ncbi:hypothetical protein BHE74_00008095 [Ensete ventricosum]|nr:hypothetical protein BHE74_00008095 [Ensete ventricosum]